jgi:hypothetical protein
MSPLVAWFSRHGVKALGGVLLIELLFHVYAVSSSKRRDAAERAAAAATPAISATPAEIATPMPATSDSVSKP